MAEWIKQWLSKRKGLSWIPHIWKEATASLTSVFLRRDGKHSRETPDAGLVYTQQETVSHTMWKVRTDK